MKTLNLTIKKKWFDMIAFGEKKEEYREIKPYWVVRLMSLDKPFEMERFSVKYKHLSGAFHYMWGYKGTQFESVDFLLNNAKCISFKDFNTIKFTNGYFKSAPSITVECKGIEIGAAKPEWSDNWQDNVFVIKLGEIVNRTK